jgi:predicted ferric reductase
MSNQRHTTQAILLASFLAVALVANAAVIYFVNAPATRLGMALLLLAIMMWLAARLGVVSRIAQSLSKGYKRRRYVKLRGVVDQFLEEVRRLNWAAAGAERGFRSQEEALKDLEAMENRLHNLVKQIRTSAGISTPEADEGDARLA